LINLFLAKMWITDTCMGTYVPMAYGHRDKNCHPQEYEDGYVYFFQTAGMGKGTIVPYPLPSLDRR
jgi:hypothetical protein